MEINIIKNKILDKEDLDENETLFLFEKIMSGELNEIEINTQIDNYNKELTDFTNTVEEFNQHYQ